MDGETLSVMDCNGIRKLTIREGLRLFGFPENYNINTNHKVAFDLLGNTIVVHVIGLEGIPDIVRILYL